MKVSVWVLVLFMGGWREGGPTVIDNIATMQECERVRALVTRADISRNRSTSGFCVEVVKVKP